jgi:chlorite dismutase
VSNQMMCSFFGLQFTNAYWAENKEKRQSIVKSFHEEIRSRLTYYSLYQAFPLNTEIDIILWASFNEIVIDTPAAEFSSLASLFSPYRQYLQMVESLWGFTRPSDYARGKSSQEIDPLNPDHKRYLVVYPFVKTAEWYRFARDTRQGMMNEHIRIGHQYPQITQLLLYSTGLQDQEFVVVYETDELPQFSALVSELRSSEARRYTERDTPLYTAVYDEPEKILGLFV